MGFQDLNNLIFLLFLVLSENLDFSILHTAHFDDSTVLPPFVFDTFQSTFSVFVLGHQMTCKHAL